MDDGSRGNCRVPVGCLVAVGVSFAGGLLCFQHSIQKQPEFTGLTSRVMDYTS